MNFIDKILEYVESEPKAVIIVLLGVITAGVLCGGLVIRSMQHTIDYNEKMISEYKQLSEKEIAVSVSDGKTQIEIYKRKNEILNEVIS